MPLVPYICRLAVYSGIYMSANIYTISCESDVTMLKLNGHFVKSKCGQDPKRGVVS